MLASSLVFLDACSTATQVRFDMPNQAVVLELPIIDLRNPASKQARVIQDRSGENTCLGDASFTPSPPLLMQSWASSIIGDELVSSLEFHAFDVCILNPAASADPDKTAIAGAGMAGAIGAGAAIASAPVIGAGMTSLSFSGFRTVDVLIDASLNGKRVKSEAAKSFSYGLSEDELRSTINEAFDRLSATYKEN